MQIQYVIINFIILLVILVLVGRKTVKRIFGGRLEKINRELDEAEEIAKILAELSAKVALFSQALRYNKQILSEIDFLAASAISFAVR